MKLKYNSEMIAGSVFAILGLILWFQIPTQIKTLEKSAINAQTLPRAAIGGLVIFSVCLLCEGLFLRAKKEVVINSEAFHSAAFKKEMRSVLFALFLIAYCFIIKPLGFLVSTLLLVLAVLLFYKARKWYLYAIPITMIGVVYFIFKVLLHVSLP